MSFLKIPTSFGTFKIYIKNEKITAVSFPAKEPKKQRQKKDYSQKTVLAKKIQKAINAYFAGADTLKDLPVSIDENATEFTKRVWKAITQVPYGETISYAELAKKAGNKKAVRAAATACGKNNIPLIIPCHRIIRTDKTPGKYSEGQKWKPLLLGLEKGYLQQKDT